MEEWAKAEHKVLCSQCDILWSIRVSGKGARRVSLCSYGERTRIARRVLHETEPRAMCDILVFVVQHLVDTPEYIPRLLTAMRCAPSRARLV